MSTTALVITILISIACGVLANLATPSIKTLFAKGLSAYRRAKIQELRNSIETRARWLNDRNDFYLFLLKEVFYVITLSIAGMTLLLLSYIDPSHLLSKLALALSFSVLANALGRGYANALVVQSVRRFNNFEDKVNQKIEKLERKLMAYKAREA